MTDPTLRGFEEDTDLLVSENGQALSIKYKAQGFLDFAAEDQVKLDSSDFKTQAK